jgi:TrmH family RNA methyltransferase
MSPFSHISVVLVRPQHSGNIGAAARAVVNHGLGTLYLVDPPAFDPDRARWMAPHSKNAINTASIVGSIPAATAQSEFVVAATARNRKWSIPQFGISDLLSLSKSKRISILFGQEDSGLSNEDIKHAHAILTFPTDAHQSLNLSQAVNVLGAHFMASLPIEDPVPLPLPPPKSITVRLQETIVTETMNILEKVDYLNRRSRDKVHNQLLQLVERSQLNHEDTAMLKGISNKIFHKIRTQSTLSNRKSKNEKN